MGSLGAVLVIAAKDVAQRSRDRSAFIMGLIGPLALALILGGTLGGADDPAAFELGVAVEDDGSIAAGFSELLADLEDDQVVEMTTARDLAELERLVDDGDVAAGFHIAAGFTDTVRAAEPSTITIVGDPGSTVATDVAEAIARTFAAELDYVSLATASVITIEGGAPEADRVAELTAAAMAQPSPIGLVPIEGEARGQDLSTYYSVSLSVFFLFFTVQFGVLSLMEEREGGTLDRVLMAPIARPAVLIGKLMSSFVVGVLSMIVLVAATTLIGGAAWGDLVPVGVLIVVGVSVAIAVAALVAAIARTTEQAVATASAAALVFGLLGGTFFPVSRADGLLSTVSFVSPHRWLLEGFRDVSFGAGVGDLGAPLAVLVGFTVVVGGAGVVLTERKLVRT
ncbi:MAG: ABC transporter permease [Actinomycetota bacterium]